MKYNCSRKMYSPAKCSHFYRLQRFRMGCHSNQVKIQDLWRENQLDRHISIKELIAALLALQLLVPNCRNGHIQLSLDNTTAAACLNHQGGTKSVQLSALATEMWYWCLERNILLSAVHMKYDFSKLNDSGNCIIRKTCSLYLI